MQPALRPEEAGRWSPDIVSHIEEDQAKLAALGIDFTGAVVEARYAWAKRVAGQILVKPTRKARRISGTEKIDNIIMHPVWGYVIFFGVMAFVFQTIFTLAQIPMNWIGSAA